MTRLPVRREFALVLGCLLVGLGLVGTFFWQDRGSLERGNRLYRDDQVQRAERLYRRRRRILRRNLLRSKLPPGQVVRRREPV